MKTIQLRVDQLGDLWKGALGPGIDMERSLEELRRIWHRYMP
jgi:hypothetical protein